MIHAPESLISRRTALSKVGCGFGYLALAALAGKSGAGAIKDPLAARQPHFSPKAKRIIFV
ncbi:MAG: DUF1501 domain-containing protein, partial [Limisphaerales bacterium]